MGFNGIPEEVKHHLNCSILSIRLDISLKRTFLERLHLPRCAGSLKCFLKSELAS